MANDHPDDVNSAAFTSLSFDCYGTLIDWIGGISGVFERLAAQAGGIAMTQRDFFDTYLHAEAQAEAGVYMPYRQVLTIVQARLAERFGLSLGPDQTRWLADSLADWRPFPDTNAALKRLKTKYRLCILSNIDRELFAATARHLQVNFDAVITAQDVESYKPARPHFDRLLKTVATVPGTHLHVAQSLYHDGVPAAELGIPFVWINRRAETNTTSARPLAVFDELTGLADWLGV
ncbi:MAG: HAD-IA family hydrolase [Phycisphaerae bacterium]